MPRVRSVPKKNIERTPHMTSKTGGAKCRMDEKRIGELGPFIVRQRNWEQAKINSGLQRNRNEDIVAECCRRDKSLNKTGHYLTGE